MTAVVIDLDKGAVFLAQRVTFDPSDTVKSFGGAKVENLVHVVQTCVDQLERDAVREKKLERVLELLKKSAWMGEVDRAKALIALVEGVDSSHGDRVDVPLQVGDPVFVPMGARVIRPVDGEVIPHSDFRFTSRQGTVYQVRNRSGNIRVNTGEEIFAIHPDDVRRVTK